jgi:hypothetical protein
MGVDLEKALDLGKCQARLGKIVQPELKEGVGAYQALGLVQQLGRL